MTVVFLALFVASIILLTISAAPKAPTWTWWAGVGSLTLAALIAVLNGWAA